MVQSPKVCIAGRKIVDTLLTTEDVATITRAPVGSVQRWRYSGTGPRSCRIGKRIVYRESEVLAWIAAQFDAKA
jgi:predicted DNA-binding transcriptional regulator AlpA